MLDDIRRHLMATIDLLLPPACLHCGSSLESRNELHLCHHCDAAIPALPRGHCSRCADPFVSAASVHLCSNCLKDPPHFTRVYAGCCFQGVAKKMIHSLKYRNKVNLAKPLGLMISRACEQALAEYQPDYIIPVPLHLTRLRQRSYNQALELARPVSRNLRLPIKPHALIRHKQTQQMTGLSAIERARNLHNAFSADGAVRGKSIILIDDVMTSGETARACSRALMQSGAREVRVAVAARAWKLPCIEKTHSVKMRFT